MSLFRGVVFGRNDPLDDGFSLSLGKTRAIGMKIERIQRRGRNECACESTIGKRRIFSEWMPSKGVSTSMNQREMGDGM